MDVFSFDSKDFQDDRYSRLRLIPWWDQDKLQSARIMVVGAGALGNELVKNLALLGVGQIYIVDMDSIEESNLTRSVLFRKTDVGRRKAEVAAERAMEINPDVKAVPLVANIVSEIGLGWFRRMDVVLGGLDNREARLAINQSCYRFSKPWIDGAIEALSGIARVFVPGQGACYECTMTENDWKMINKRKSCALLTHEQLNEGKIPTTPTSSSVIAGIQVQELLKLLHSERKLPLFAGKGYVFNGLTHDSYIVEYQEKPGCMSHESFDPLIECLWLSSKTTLSEALSRIRQDMGSETIIEIDREIVTAAECKCGYRSELFSDINRLTREMIVCPECGGEMRFSGTHRIDGSENFLSKTLEQFGIPSLHVLCGRSNREARYYEMTADEATSLYW